MIISAFILLSYTTVVTSAAHANFYGLPTSELDAWYPGKTVSFTIQWTTEPIPIGEYRVNMDRAWKSEISLDNVTITPNNPHTITGVVPNVAPGMWYVKLESTKWHGRDYGKSDKFPVILPPPNALDAAFQSPQAPLMPPAPAPPTVEAPPMSPVVPVAPVVPGPAPAPAPPAPVSAPQAPAPAPESAPAPASDLDNDVLGVKDSGKYEFQPETTELEQLKQSQPPAPFQTPGAQLPQPPLIVNIVMPETKPAAVPAPGQISNPAVLNPAGFNVRPTASQPIDPASSKYLSNVEKATPAAAAA